MSLQEFVPPMARSAARRLRDGVGRFWLGKGKRYGNYAEALVDCHKDAYENADIVKVVVAKTQRYRDDLFNAIIPVSLNATSAYSLCALLAAFGEQEINVLDFGGAAGTHYFLARSILPASCRLRWTVVETPAMAKSAGQALTTEELRFSSNLLEAAQELGRIDLLHTSGTLQCVEDPFACLQQLLSLSAEHILFNRLGLSAGDHDVITVYESWLSWNGPGPMPKGMEDRKVRYPFVFPRQSLFLEKLAAAYTVALKFEDASGVLAVRGESIIGLGLLARKTT